MQKHETIEFYNYYDHRKRFGFTWKYAPMKLRYEITLSEDEKTNKKNFKHRKM